MVDVGAGGRRVSDAMSRAWLEWTRIGMGIYVRSWGVN